MEDFSQLNWLAIGVGTVVAFAFGMLWYNPKVMGTKWASGKEVDMGSADQAPPLFPLLTQLLALFLLALVIGLTANIDAFLIAILAILAAATFVASSGSFVRPSFVASMIDFGYVFLCGVIMIIAQRVL